MKINVLVLYVSKKKAKNERKYIDFLKTFKFLENSQKTFQSRKTSSWRKERPNLTPPFLNEIFWTVKTELNLAAHRRQLAQWV